jgi:hypothetical protein
MRAILISLYLVLATALLGCGNRILYKGDYPFKEAQWIRMGEPIIFEDEAWYPTDDVENLLDQEVIIMGLYREIPFYIEKRDVRPFNRIYTKFGYHKYRVFLKNESVQ